MTTELENIRAMLKAMRAPERVAVARAAGCAESLPRKIVYEPTRNFGVLTIAPLVAYFATHKQPRAKKCAAR